MEKNRTDDRTEEGRRHSSIAKTKERFVILSQTGRFSVREEERGHVVMFIIDMLSV
jgi:hypothetical protein